MPTLIFSRVGACPPCCPRAGAHGKIGILTSMNNLWKNRALNKDTKARLMRALVRPVVTYGCESWMLKASDKKRTAEFEMTAQHI